MAKKRLSEIAIAECLDALTAACRLPIEPTVAAAFMPRFAKNFRRKCDEKDGAEYWSRIGGAMRNNSRYIGTFAEYFAKNKDSKVVTAFELELALIIVRATCLDRIYVGKESPAVFYEMCLNIDLDQELSEGFASFLALVLKKHREAGGQGKYQTLSRVPRDG